MKRFSVLLIAVVLLCGFVSPVSAAQNPTYPADLNWGTYLGGCGADSGDFCSAIVTWLERNGGMPVFGLPIKPMDARSYGYDLYFERFRVEIHTDQPAGSVYLMQLGIMGEERLIQLGRIWQNEPRATPQPGCRYFAETGHNLCGTFQSYWTTHGRDFGQKGVTFEEALSLFGYPITEAVSEIGSDGVARTTQWFQRVRMEDHGSDGILLGLLDSEIIQSQGGQPTLVAPVAPAPPPTPADPAPTGERIGAVCRDGTHSNATGRGACSHHGGVDHWIYK